MASGSLSIVLQTELCQEKNPAKTLFHKMCINMPCALVHGKGCGDLAKITTSLMRQGSCPSTCRSRVGDIHWVSLDFRGVCLDSTGSVHADHGTVTTRM